MLPFVDDFTLFAKSFEAAMELKDVTFALLSDLGLNSHPTKGYHTASQVGDHLGITIDMKEKRVPGPRDQAHKYRGSGKTATGKGRTEKGVDARQVPRRKGAVLTLGNTTC